MYGRNPDGQSFTADENEGLAVGITTPQSFGNLLISGLSLFTILVPVGALTAFVAHPPGPSLGVALFVPGWTGSKEDFRLLLPLVAAKGWTAVAYSQRGQADSAAPEGIESFTMEHLAGDVVRVARDVAVRFGNESAVHLVGHSFGGLIARQAAISSPSTFASVTMLCSGPHGFGDCGLNARSNDARDLVVKEGLVALWKKKSRPQPLTELDEFDRLRYAASSRNMYLSGDQILRFTLDNSEALLDTELRLMVAHGETDHVWPISDQYKMAGSLLASYKAISNSGHSPNLDNPVECAAVLSDFFGANFVCHVWRHIIYGHCRLRLIESLARAVWTIGREWVRTGQSQA